MTKVVDKSMRGVKSLNINKECYMKQRFSFLFILVLSVLGSSSIFASFARCEAEGGVSETKQKKNRFSKSKHFCEIRECTRSDGEIFQENIERDCISKKRYQELQKQVVLDAVGQQGSGTIVRGDETAQGSESDRVVGILSTQNIVEMCKKAIDDLGEERGGRICDRYIEQNNQRGELEVDQPVVQLGPEGGDGDILADTEDGTVTFTKEDGKCFKVAKKYRRTQKLSKKDQRKWDKCIDGKVAAVEVDIAFKSCVEEGGSRRNCREASKNGCTYDKDERSCFGGEEFARQIAAAEALENCPTCGIHLKKNGELKITQAEDPRVVAAKEDRKARNRASFFDFAGKVGSTALQGFFAHSIVKNIGENQVDSINACVSGNADILNSHSNQLDFSAQQNLAPEFLSTGDFLNLSCNGSSGGNFAGIGNSLVGGLFGGGLFGNQNSFGTSFQTPSAQFGFGNQQGSTFGVTGNFGNNFGNNFGVTGGSNFNSFNNGFNSGFSSPGFTGGSFPFTGGNTFASTSFTNQPTSSFVNGGSTFGGGFGATSGSGGFSGLGGFAF